MTTRQKCQHTLKDYVVELAAAIMLSSPKLMYIPILMQIQSLYKIVNRMNYLSIHQQNGSADEMP